MSAHRILHDMFKSPFLMTDPGSGGTLTVDRFGAVFPIVTAGAEARTLAQPTKAGLLCLVELDTDGGDLTLTVTGGYNQAAATSITFGDAGDWVLFQSIKVGASYYWRVLAYEGTGLTLAEHTITTATITTANVVKENASIGVSTAAAGTTTADAGALPAGTAKVYPTTAADDTKGVKINAADKVDGRMLFIGNGVGNKTLKVYPPAGGNINGLGADAAFSSDSGKGVIIVCLNSTANTWLAW